MPDDVSAPVRRSRRGPWWAVLLGGAALLVTALVLAVLARTPTDFGTDLPSAGAVADLVTEQPTEQATEQAAATREPARPIGPATAESTRPVPVVRAENRRSTAVPAPRRASAPVGLQIPDVDMDIGVVPVGVREDGQMDIPGSGLDVGWYRYGSAPGQDEGSVVLASHVDTLAEGKGVLARLTELRAGDLVSVTLEDGSVVDYRVTGRSTVPKVELDTAALFDRSGPERLRLVTCGGPWQPERSSYRDNVIVTAEPVTASS